MSGKNEFIRKINIRLDMMDEAHAAVLWKLDKESEEKKISRSRLILQHLYEYYQQEENGEDAAIVATKEYVDKKISALECEVLEKVLQVIAGSIPEKPLGRAKGAEPGEEIPGLPEKNSGTEEKEGPDIFSDPVIMAAAQKWG